MTLEQLYTQIGDYDELLKRLPEPIAGTFVLRFPEDPSSRDLIEAWNAGDERAAFEAAHSAKGVCANLSLKRIAKLSETICEALRPGNDDLRATTDVDALVAEFAVAYDETVQAIEAYRAS